MIHSEKSLKLTKGFEILVVMFVALQTIRSSKHHLVQSFVLSGRSLPNICLKTLRVLILRLKLKLYSQDSIQIFRKNWRLPCKFTDNFLERRPLCIRFSISILTIFNQMLFLFDLYGMVDSGFRNSDSLLGHVVKYSFQM